jgi:hypothetical protein
MTPAGWRRRFGWAVCALLLVSTAEASNRLLPCDVKGDGNTGPVSSVPFDSPLLQVRLPRTGTVTRLRHTSPVQHLAARGPADVRELFTADGGISSGWQRPHRWRFWKSDVIRGFLISHARRRGPGTVKAPSDETVDEGAPVDDATEGLGSAEPSRESTTTRDPVAAEVPAAQIIPAPHPDATLVSTLPLDLSTPRAPPA